MGSERDYEAASDRYADESARALPIGPATTGKAASAAGRDFLVKEYGSIEAVEREIRQGRRKVGDPRRGDSPVVRGRIPEADRAAFDLLIAQTGKKESELVREAVHLLLQRHDLVAS